MRIGFIGLGIMGTPMALNLLKAGLTVTVYNRTAAKCGPLVDAGAAAVGSGPGLYVAVVVGGLRDCQWAAKAGRHRAQADPQSVSDRAAFRHATVASGTVGQISLAFINAHRDYQLMGSNYCPLLRCAPPFVPRVRGKNEKSSHPILSSVYPCLRSSLFPPS